MMALLLPLGLLALLSLAVLIIIYLIKPNYQQKVLSTTYVWRVSLRYKKRKLPVSKLRNILIFLCQLLILAICSVLIARPVLVKEKRPEYPERVAIIDASASMLIEKDGFTRFQRAIGEIRTLAEETFREGGKISVILANAKPEQWVEPSGSEEEEYFNTRLGELEKQCSFGSADMEKAVELADNILDENRDAQVLLFTATEYLNDGGAEIRNVAAEGEWNAAVLGCSPVMNEGFYDFEVTVGCYGRSESLEVSLEAAKANGTANVTMTKTVQFDASLPQQTIVFDRNDQIASSLNAGISVYDSLYISVEAKDSFSDDNYFYLYGGVKPTIKVLYASSQPNIFFNNALVTFRDLMKTKWNIDMTWLSASAELPEEGYDFYIFEHRMPKRMPKDGAVFLVDPGSSPEGLGITFGDTVPVSRDTTLAAGLPHPITNHITPENITVSEYRRIVSSDGFEELMYYVGEPILLVKEGAAEKVAVLTINLHKSNLALLMDFPFLIRNIFHYFVPSTFDSYCYEVGDLVTFNARGTDLKLGGRDTDVDFESLPYSVRMEMPGVYTLTQTSLSGKTLLEQFFVSIPAAESDITKSVDAFPSLTRITLEESDNYDLLFYVALGLTALLFVEWWLQARENMR